MAYLALYRKYRPLTFAGVIGQEFVTSALRHAVAGNRLAHAYLFSGPRGTGKTSTARIFARAINCENPQAGEPCNVCGTCKSILAGQWGLVEIDGASHNRVEDMRALLDAVLHVPMAGQFSVYIIDEVHMLSNAAFNAFLKTLEEPPAHVKFILATTEPFKVPRTIHSRCQHYLFQSVPTVTIAGLIQQVCTDEGITIDPLSARLVAEAGNGSIRDALSVLDRVLAYCAGGITAEAVQQLLGLGDVTAVLTVLEAAAGTDEAAFMEALEAAVLQGHDLAELTRSLLDFGRVLLFLGAGITDEALLGMPMTPEQRERASSLGQQIGQERLYGVVEIIAALQQQLKFDVDKRLGFELGLLQLRRHLHLQAQPPAGRLSREQPATAAAPSLAPSPASSTATPPERSQRAASGAHQDDADALEALARQLEESAVPSARKSARPTQQPAPAARGPAPQLSIAEGHEPRWRAFLESCRPERPAWIPLLQGLAITHVAENRIRIDRESSLPVALAWLRDPQQMQALKDAWYTFAGAPLEFERSRTPAAPAQPMLAGLPPEADQVQQVAAELKTFFPDATIRPE